MNKLNDPFILKFIFLVLGLASFTSAFSQGSTQNSSGACPSQFSQSCTFQDDILVNKHYRAKDHYHHNGNGETNYYLSSQVSQSADLSHLTLSTQIVPPGQSYQCNDGGTCKYLSGWIDTQGLWSTVGVNHGYVEVSATMPVSTSGLNPDPRYQGMWPAIWMLPNNSGPGWPTYGEIDISELHGADAFHSGTTLHYNNIPGTSQYADGTFAQNPYTAANTNSYGNYHTYGLEWNFNQPAPYLATWYDGVRVAIRYLNVLDKQKGYNLFDLVFSPGQNSGGYYLVLNTATGGSFGPTTSKTSNGSGKDANNPLLQMNINSIKSWRLE